MLMKIAVNTNWIFGYEQILDNSEIQTENKPFLASLNGNQIEIFSKKKKEGIIYLNFLLKLHKK